LKARVIDATKCVRVVHQNHHYQDAQTGRKFRSDQEILKGEAAKKNIEMAGGWDHAFTLDDATHWLMDDRLRLAPLTSDVIYHKVKRLPILRPETRPLFAAVRILRKPFRAKVLGK
jgi:hypothetical protein